MSEDKRVDTALSVDEMLAMRGRLLDRNGGWIAGDSVYSYGVDLLRDMVHNKSYFHVLVLNILGELPDDRFCKWLESLYICMSWPDPRVWCNGIGALAGAAKTSAIAGTVAGVLASDSTMYGPHILYKAMPFIQRAQREIKQGLSVEDFVEREVEESSGRIHLMGFARPIAKGDERVAAMLKRASDLGYSVGQHLNIALEIEKYLLERYDESLNIGGYVAAFLSDLGIDVEKGYQLFAVMVTSGVTACHNEQREKPYGSFLPLTCDDIEYTGPDYKQLFKQG